ncbi:hypothetical protein [Halobacteriovorax sp.]|uniref:hypothetical protein n=1 Tax=Halobacteriovorax sp. TaxID=2020862 RepID=UPI003563DDDA
MKKSLFIFILILSSCKNQTDSKFIPFSKKYKPKTQHEELVKSIYTGDDDFSKSLNTFMSGPTSQIALSRPDSPSSNCGYGLYDEIDFDENNDEVTFEDFVDVIHEKEQMNGFPLSIDNSGAGSIKGEQQVIWDECKGIKSNYDDGAQSSTCKKRKVSKEFINFFDKNFSTCVQQAVKGYKKGNNQAVDAIKFSHAGIAGDPRHSNRSYHSVNRAIDIRQISYIQGGKKVTLKVSDQKKSPAKEFFEKFRKCWHDKIVETSSKCPGSSNKGSIGHEHKNHQHHLHLSLPYCPRVKNGSKYFLK